MINTIASVIALLILLALFLGLYFLPAYIARQRRHRNATPIFLTNLFFGFTVVGWAVALIWATTADVVPSTEAGHGFRQQDVSRTTKYARPALIAAVLIVVILIAALLSTGASQPVATTGDTDKHTARQQTPAVQDGMPAAADDLLTAPDE